LYQLCKALLPADIRMGVWFAPHFSEDILKIKNLKIESENHEKTL